MTEHYRITVTPLRIELDAPFKCFIYYHSDILVNTSLEIISKLQFRNWTFYNQFINTLRYRCSFNQND